MFYPLILLINQILFSLIQSSLYNFEQKIPWLLVNSHQNKCHESTRPQVNSHPSNFISTKGGFYGASFISLAHKFYDLNNLSCFYLVIFSSDIRK